MYILKNKKRNEIIVAEGDNSDNYTILYRNTDINNIIEFIKNKF